ncbi:hypothetical protein BO70DRAFT_346490 [Aspergillus heteromorphus CBS 117.55]|uniref:Uncharacterized protein n=1 Tax=Aspergillus heteromorphus CBS 117.55 TaxID=1448321 RepID=A0A317UUN5_9EURO|nr:uncharacterized protein BO70DRAFT_346490 [Aspergillus heteromorphus CBS 117.55]PWY65315.1 hypothetical protein BO70DRAFT_346490 [Aspergillus heteromorphus CBS 117.55]
MQVPEEYAPWAAFQLSPNQFYAIFNRMKDMLIAPPVDSDTDSDSDSDASNGGTIQSPPTSGVAVPRGRKKTVRWGTVVEIPYIEPIKSQGSGGKRGEGDKRKGKHAQRSPPRYPSRLHSIRKPPTKGDQEMLCQNLWNLAQTTERRLFLAYDLMEQMGTDFMDSVMRQEEAFQTLMADQRARAAQRALGQPSPPLSHGRSQKRRSRAERNPRRHHSAEVIISASWM